MAILVSRDLVLLKRLHNLGKPSYGTEDFSDLKSVKDS